MKFAHLYYHFAHLSLSIGQLPNFNVLYSQSITYNNSFLILPKMKSNISQARINQQIRNMLKQPLPYLKAAPLQNDIYTWHFTIQGPQNTDFHEGLYHGQILLPFEYPFKPPDIVFMNKNARFQVNTKICLTITQYHPEEWNSGWTIRTMLEAVMSLFSESVQGIGYEEGSPQQRRLLAKKSHDFKCDKCGVLKDLLKPREAKKDQDKKEQVKPEQHLQGISTQKLEYASDLNLRKTKTQDARDFVQRKFSQVQTVKIQQRPQITNKKQFKTEQKVEQAHTKKQKNEQNPNKLSERQQNKPQPMKFHIMNDAMALNLKFQKNYISWGRMLKSQKWSKID